MLSRLLPLLLLVLTRDGALHRFDGHHDTAATIARAAAVTALGDGRVAVLAGGRITVDGKAIAGRFDDVRGLAGGALLWARTDGAVVQIDVRTGKRAVVLALPRLHRLAADGNDVFAEADGDVVHVGTTERWKIAGQPIALAAGDGKLWAATKAGPLVELDRATGKERTLPLGDWWGTLALAYGDHALYAVTVAGKLWRIDPGKNQKTIVAMDGWQGAIDLSVLR
jgi:hypothetical protein